MTVSSVFKLQVVFWNESEMIRADILEGTNPATLLCEAADDLVFGDAEVTLGVKRVEVTDHTVDLKV